MFYDVRHFQNYYTVMYEFRDDEDGSWHKEKRWYSCDDELIKIKYIF